MPRSEPLCPDCDRYASLYIAADSDEERAYCSVCDKDFVVKEPTFTRISTPEDATRFLVKHFGLPEWMEQHLLYRCRNFGSYDPDRYL